MRDLKIAYGHSRFDTSWRNDIITWPDFCQRISTTVTTTETLDEFLAMKRAMQDKIKDIGGFVAGHLASGRRKRENVLARSMLTLDLDTPPADAWDHIRQVLDCACCIYSTHKHRPDAPRLRLVIPLSRDVTGEEYPAIGRMVACQFGIDWCDDSTYDIERLMYWPSTAKNAVFFRDTQDGPWLDPDKVLALYDDWRDTTTWPTSSRESVAKAPSNRKLTDPRNKPGLIGAFCRTYSVTQAIDTFLADVYEPTGHAERYTYAKGESSGGLVIFDDLYAYSFHGTDPAGGHARNAFDLVRIHHYSHLDDTAAPGTPVNKLLSFQAMSTLAANDTNVRATLATERQAEAATDFTPASEENAEVDVAWQTDLEIDGKGRVKDTLANHVLILQSDPALEGIVFNEHRDGIDVRGHVPWNRYKAGWTDNDDAALRVYLQKTYGLYAQTRTRDALRFVSASRSYHPIRDWLENLPAWDRQPRIEQLLVDYFGATDDAYTAAVMRKTLVAAVARIYEAGVKFDSVLILNGPQGIGKSTFFARLAGDWFSDSLTLTDMKDKAGAEKLQGNWIVELSELAGIRKVELESMKSFISRRDDKYRAAYGTVVESHPRQCVIVGSTNAQDGFLRDLTGNRRFWPVTCSGESPRKPWQLDNATVAQIWAEALAYYHDGEELFLTGDAATQATIQQTEALETDERVGLVAQYLDLLLPDGWPDMGLFERRNWLRGDTEFGTPASTPGTVLRQQVSNMEIWAECFRHEIEAMQPRDSYAIAAMMRKIPGWQRGAKRVNQPIYHLQRVWERTGDNQGSTGGDNHE